MINVGFLTALRVIFKQDFLVYGVSETLLCDSVRTLSQSRAKSGKLTQVYADDVPGKVTLISPFCCRVHTHDRNKCQGYSTFFKVRELSGNFKICQGNRKFCQNVREMSDSIFYILDIRKLQ